MWINHSIHLTAFCVASLDCSGYFKIILRYLYALFQCCTIMSLNLFFSVRSHEGRVVAIHQSLDYLSIFSMPTEKEVFTGGSTHNAEKMCHLDVVAMRNLQYNFVQIPTNNTFQSGTLVFSMEPLYSGRAIDAGCKSSRLSPRGLDMKSITWEMYHLFTHNVSFMLASVAGYYINHSL